jgi:hypothetical protein
MTASIFTILLAGCTNPIAPVTASVVNSLPTPTNLVATPGNAQISLAWTGPSGVTSFNLYYSTAANVTPANGTKISITSGTSYTLSGLTNATTYYFTITAVSSAGESGQSNEAFIAPIGVPSAPTALTANSLTGQAVFQWKSGTVGSPATSFNLYYSTTTGVTPATGTKVSGITNTTYTLSGLTAGTTYYAVVTGVTQSGESPASAQAYVTITIPVTSTTKLSSYIPTQYIAKLYTESLGRAPDQAGWLKFVNSFTSAGCSVGELETIGYNSSTFFDSPEFLTANPDPQSQTIAMYRAILNRDPDQTGFNTYSGQLKSGMTPAIVASNLYATTEFATDANTICGTNQTTYNPDYSFGTTPAFNATPLTSGITTYAALVSALSTAGSTYNSTKQVQTVTLAQAALIYVPAMLTVPSGVILQTSGTPLPNNYTQMARLTRTYTTGTTNYTTAVVQVNGGGTLQSVWIDGQRSIVGTTGAQNVDTVGGTGTLIANNRSSDPSVGSNITSEGVGTMRTCKNETISGNLLTGYTEQHGFSTPADGMTMYCENLTISNNSIIDMSDIAIVLMSTSVAGTTQNSTITGNTIISAGVSTNAPIAVDATTAVTFTGPLVNGNNTPGTNQQYPCFAGTTMTNNTFWTGPYTTFDFGIMVGARPFFAAPRLYDSTCTGTQAGLGPTFTNNGNGILSANVQEGIEVDGFQNVTLTNDGVANPFTVTLSPKLFPAGLPAYQCPSTMVLLQAGDSSGNLPAATCTKNIDSCTFINNGATTVPTCP